MRGDFCNFGAMTSPDKSKRLLLQEIRSDEWRKSISEGEYENSTNIIEEIHKKNLEVVSRRNEAFKHKKIVAKQAPVYRNVSVKARQAYEKWKRENQEARIYPEVSVQNLLLLIHYLNSEPTGNEKDDLRDCLKRQNSEFDTFWDSPSYILKVLRKCVLTRDWSNMTYFSLILLNYDKKYLHVVKNMCRIMAKFNPLVKECELEDQFKMLTEAPSDKLVIV